MATSLALALLTVGICTLFVLDRDKSQHKQAVVWLPVAWLWINGSRPIAEWIGSGYESSSLLPGTSFVDQAIAGALTLLGLIVLARRRKRVLATLQASWPIVVYFAFALISLTWSDFSGWGFKRWVRALGELTMVMLVASDDEPRIFLRRVFSRVSFVLIPLSIFLIKYYPRFGRAYDQWGYQTNIGVTTNKNSLGVITLVLVLGTVWQILELMHARKTQGRKRRIIAQSVILAMSIYLLRMAHSATCIACLLIGGGVIFMVNSSVMRRKPKRIHAFFAAALVVSAVIYALGGEETVTKALGRKPDLTGRTLVWEVVIPAAQNPIAGAGFETFWLGPRAESIRSVLGFVNEAHNGYIETYLNLGLIGVGLIVLILWHGYHRAAVLSRKDPELGGLMLAFVVIAANYSISEAGFRMLNPMWFFLLLSVTLTSRLTGMKPVRALPKEPVLTESPLRMEPESSPVEVPQMHVWNYANESHGDKQWNHVTDRWHQ